MANAMGVDPVWLQGFDVPMDAYALAKPIPIAMLKRMGNKAYWHVSLEGGASKDKWNILPPHVAASPKDYHYGERWAAFHQQIYPVDMGDLRALAAEPDPKNRRVWVRPLNYKSPLQEGWAELDTSICLHAVENGYGKAWNAYAISLRLDAEEPGQTL